MDEKRGLTTVAGLSLVGGFLETYTYRTRSGVFANAQTGNVLKMILIVLGERGESLFPCAWSLILFCIGVLLAERMKEHGHEECEWMKLEMIVFIWMGMIPSSSLDFLVTGGVSLLCAVQSERFVRLPTTICTGNIRKAVRCREKREGREPLVSIIGFVIGAVLGVWTTRRWEHRAVWILVPVVWMLAKKKERRKRLSHWIGCAFK
ncbi:YoaK family protein [Dubosiella muris]|uniref:YoaK family protein n=1 Tax=Dubosiella muris TaxID=3038133 RepID=UPI0014419407|nr:YoaK family protein [Dubosiella muris]